MRKLQFALINWSGNLEPQFKIALVLGPSRVPGKQRVRVWLNASQRYAPACAVATGKLSTLVSHDLTPRQQRVLASAVVAAKSLP